MNELQAIVDAYAEACARGERAALATVVNVIGSAYRRPGARMLITESGRTAGSISGGCLERDAVERAAQVMASGTARVVGYDTRGDEDVVWGLGLGCNGVVEVLLESLHEGSCGALALQFIGDCLRARKSGVLATVIRAPQTANDASLEHRIEKPGERLMLDEHELSLSDQSGSSGKLVACVREGAREALMNRRPVMRTYEVSRGGTEIFFDVIRRPRSLIIFGAEHDAVPVVRLARALGWHVTIVDTRARGATRDRFPEADAVVPCRAEDVASRITLTQDTAAVVMTHNYLDDVELLRALLPSPVSYLGILGPRQRTEKLLKGVGTEDFGLAGSHPARLHSPVGIDIGAETPEEIALAVIAEIKAVWSGRQAGFLRDGNAPIHDDCAVNLAPIEFRIKRQTAVRETASNIVCGSS